MSETRYVDVGGDTVEFDTAGEGPGVMLLSGLPMNSGRWREAGYVDRRSTDRTVVTVDPLGDGESGCVHAAEAIWPEALWPEALVSHAEAVLDAGSIEQCDIWGIRTAPPWRRRSLGCDPTARRR